MCAQVQVAFYAEYGWIMLPRLVDPAFAEYMLDLGIQRREARASDPDFTREHLLKPGTSAGPTSPACARGHCTSVSRVEWRTRGHWPS